MNNDALVTRDIQNRSIIIVGTKWCTFHETDRFMKPLLLTVISPGQKWNTPLSEDGKNVWDCIIIWISKRCDRKILRSKVESLCDANILFMKCTITPYAKILLTLVSESATYIPIYYEFYFIKIECLYKYLQRIFRNMVRVYNLLFWVISIPIFDFKTSCFMTKF